MPKLDGTGPAGQGAGSGRGMGNCGGGGMRRSCCGRLGRMGRKFFSPKNELSALQDNEQFLKDELEAVQEEIKTAKAQK